jgi:spore coat protein CotF
MVKKGYYPLEAASSTEINIMSSIYNEVREPAMMQ